MIAEQHRRRFGAYPETLEAIRGELEVEPNLLPFHDPVRLSRSDGELTVRIDSAVHPTTVELSTAVARIETNTTMKRAARPSFGRAAPFIRSGVRP